MSNGMKGVRRMLGVDSFRNLTLDGMLEVLSGIETAREDNCAA